MVLCFLKRYSVYEFQQWRNVISEHTFFTSYFLSSFTGFQSGLIFLGVVGGTSCFLIAIYFCVKSDKCFCNVKGDGGGETPDTEYVQVATDDSATEYSLDTECSLDTTSIFSSKSQPALHSIAEVDEITEGSHASKAKKKKWRNITGISRSQSLQPIKKRQIQASLHLTIKYSKQDLSLFFIIHSITDLKPEEILGIDQVRISMALLPAKKYRRRTKLMPVDNPEFGSFFKFANFSRTDLLQSAVRFRLYGRPLRVGMHLGGDRLLGELTVHLADVSRKEKVSTTRPFQPPSKTSKWLILTFGGYELVWSTLKWKQWYWK